MKAKDITLTLTFKTNGRIRWRLTEGDTLSGPVIEKGIDLTGSHFGMRYDALLEKHGVDRVRVVIRNKFRKLPSKENHES